MSRATAPGRERNRKLHVADGIPILADQVIPTYQQRERCHKNCDELSVPHGLEELARTLGFICVSPGPEPTGDRTMRTSLLGLRLLSLRWAYGCEECRSHQESRKHPLPFLDMHSGRARDSINGADIDTMSRARTTPDPTRERHRSLHRLFFTRARSIGRPKDEIG
jgi:hypothetical protein